MQRPEFEAKKQAAEEARIAKLNPKPKKLASADKDFSGYPLLQALAEREELVRNGKLTTIVYIRHKNSKGQEVSGYIDYAHRLKTENFEPVRAPHTTWTILQDDGPNHLGLRCNAFPGHQNGPNHLGLCALQYFERKKRLMPHTSDLSFYNW